MSPEIDPWYCFGDDHHHLHDRLQQRDAGPLLGVAERSPARTGRTRPATSPRRGTCRSAGRTPGPRTGTGTCTPSSRLRGGLPRRSGCTPSGSTPGVIAVHEVDVVRVRLHLRSSSSSISWTFSSICSGVERLVLHVDDGELAAAARLLDELVSRSIGLAERLAVRHPRLAELDQLGSLLRHVRAPASASRRDFQVQLAHAGEDRVLRLLVGVRLQRRVVADQPAERLAELAGVERLGERQRLRR